jgi:K+-sensing histidine kinase KdpD
MKWRNKRMHNDLQLHEPQRGQGRLKIFLGLAAGVGKTYTMLEAAQKKMQEGVDVLVGHAETHGRPETAKVLEPLKRIPLKNVIYKEKSFQELDLDEILRLKPKLVLVDELAHTNVPGSKHVKRWQDVVEILEAGIDVFTTLNIQHIESYKDLVEGIVGIQIWETVPDHIVERATHIELVDIPPAELLQRLREGKVYTGDLSLVALRNFFQEDRLTALRELALRFTADMVDLELHEMLATLRLDKAWKPRERLLIAINHYPHMQQLIRAARRLATTLHAPWVVVYVDDGTSLDDNETTSLSKNLALARDLGAEVVTTQDAEIAEGIGRVIEQKSITQVMIGKSYRHNLRNFFKRSLAEHLAQACQVDVHIIRPSVYLPLKKKKDKWWIRLFKGLTHQINRRRDLLIKRERSTQAIYEIVRAISAAPTSVQLFKAVKEKLGSILQGSCEIIPLLTTSDELNFEGTSSIAHDEKEKAVARWVFENGKEAGWSTTTLPLVRYLYIPLKGYKEHVGVLAFRSTGGKPLLPEETNFLYTVSQQLAYFLERARSEEKERRHQFFSQIEKIYTKVLQSISDGLSRPLQTIQEALIDCQEEEVMENVKIYTAFSKIKKTSESLLRIAENAEAMAKLSGGVVSFKKELQDIATLIHTCHKEIQYALKQHHFEVRIAENVPLIACDFSLMNILIHHLLMNAIEYSPPQSAIIVEAGLLDNTFFLSVLDEGRGIPEDVMDRVFEKFYRVHGTVSPGLGLGLAIVKAIAEIHNGEITVRNRSTGGTQFSLLLPLE